MWEVELVIEFVEQTSAGRRLPSYHLPQKRSKVKMPLPSRFFKSATIQHAQR